MRGGKELILATKSYAVDYAIRSWWCIVSTASLLVAALVGTLWHFPFPGKIVCSILAGLLLLSFGLTHWIFSGIFGGFSNGRLALN